MTFPFIFPQGETVSQCPNRLIFVISSVARDLVFLAIYEEKISRLRLEMTISRRWRKQMGDGSFVRRFHAA